MAIDTSIYGNLQPVQAPSLADAASNGMKLSQMAMQQQQMQRQMQTQQALRDSYAKNTDANGNVNHDAVLSDLAKIDPVAALSHQELIGKASKASADAQVSRSDAYQKKASVFAGAMHALEPLSDEQRAIAFPQVIANLKKQNIIDPSQNIPDDYKPDWYNSVLQKAQTHIGEGSKDYSDIQKTKAETNKAYADADKTRSETYKRNPDILGQTDDPAKLVPNLVPKEHQAKALEEIKNAQDIKNIAPQIMAAFDKGSSRNPIVAAQGQREFEGLINTTVKDAEGTTRQAAFDSIHKTMTPSGLLASPGENEARKRTVMEYLASKSAAPTSRAYGIDLAKFSGTSPYQIPDKTPSPGGVIPTAMAGENKAPAPAPQPPNTIRMRGPNGQIKWVPMSQKGEAIAAGGSVVN